MGMHKRAHLPGELLGALQTSIRLPHRHSGACLSARVHARVSLPVSLRSSRFETQAKIRAFVRSTSWARESDGTKLSMLKYAQGDQLKGAGEHIPAV
eukprot:6446583-Pyramimonas_sp.AAC.1